MHEKTVAVETAVRAIQRQLQDPLALQILSGVFHEGQVILVDRGADGLTFTSVVQGEVVD